MLDFLLGIGLSAGSSLLGSLFGGQRKPITQREVNFLETHDEPVARYGEPIPIVYGRARVQGIYLAAQVPPDWERDDFFNGQSQEWVLTYVYYGKCGVMWSILPNYNNGPIVQRIWMNKRLYYEHSSGFDPLLGQYWGRWEGVSANHRFNHDELDPNLSFLGSNHTAFRRACYSAFTRLRLNNSDGGLFNSRYPNMEAEINTHSAISAPKLGLIIKDLLMEAGFLEEEIDVTELLGVDVRGAVILPGRLADKLAGLQACYFFEILDTGAKLKFITAQRPSVSAYIPATALAAREESADQGLRFEETEQEPSELPTCVRILFNDSQDFYQAAEVESFKLEVFGAVNVQEINTGLSLTPDEAVNVANRQLLLQWSRRKSYRFSVLNRYNYLEAGDLLDVELRVGNPTRMQITRINTQPSGVLAIEAIGYDDTVWGGSWAIPAGYATPTLGTPGTPINLGQLDVLVNSVTNADGSVTYVEGVDYSVNPSTGIVTPLLGGAISGEIVINWQGSAEDPPPLSVTPVATTLEAIECNLPSDSDVPGVYLFANAPNPWQSSTLWISKNGADYISSGTINRSIFGVCDSILPDGAGADLTSSLTITLPAEMVFPPAGRALVGAEILDYAAATLTSETETTKTYSLSTFNRAMRLTSGAGHTASEPFYLLSGYKYTYAITAADIGAVVNFKAVNPGQALTDVTAVSVTITGAALTVLAPRIDAFSPTQGAEGTAISIYGAGFTGAVGASINGTALDSFAVASDTLITGVVGAGTTTGKVEVGAAESLADFVIFSASIDWGDIGGNLSEQDDLKLELDAKMTILVYDPDEDGIVDLAAEIEGAGTAGNDKYYGTDGTGTPGFYSALLAVPFGGFIETIADKTYPLFTPDRSYKIKSLRVKSESGTCTWAIQIDGVNVTGLSPISVSSVESLTLATGANTVASGQRVTIVSTANASALNVEFTIMLETV